VDPGDPALDMLDHADDSGHARAVGTRAVRVVAERRRDSIEHDAAPSEIARDHIRGGNTLAPDRERPRGTARIIVRVIIATRWRDGARAIVCATIIEYPARPQLGEHVAPIAAAPACNEHAARVAIAQHEAVATVQGAAAAPGAALSARVAEDCAYRLIATTDSD
jgi:hypothetical protein